MATVIGVGILIIRIQWLLPFLLHYHQLHTIQYH